MTFLCMNFSFHSYPTSLCPFCPLSMLPLVLYYFKWSIVSNWHCLYPLTSSASFLSHLFRTTIAYSFAFSIRSALISSSCLFMVSCKETKWSISNVSIVAEFVAWRSRIFGALGSLLIIVQVTMGLLRVFAVVRMAKPYKKYSSEICVALFYYRLYLPRSYCRWFCGLRYKP